MNHMEDNQNIIEVKNLVKKFDDLTAVDNVSFSVKKAKSLLFSVQTVLENHDD
jgi:ABC-type branched-subunit amino acid transport system ATPase component